MVSRPHMKKVRSKDTKPEMRLRRLVWAMSYRGYRTNLSTLPGKPDIAFTRHKRAIFLHGCFWHGHNCRAGRNVPKTNQAYWGPKLRRNKERDGETMAALKRIGWKTQIIWECELKEARKVKQKIKKFCAW